MHPVTHFLSGWAAAKVAGCDRRERAIAAWACVAPDLDGLGVIGDILTAHSRHPTEWFGRYHHVLFHGLAGALVTAAVAAAVGSPRIRAALIAFAAFHLHLFEDLLGSGGPHGDRWDISYLGPFSDRVDLSWAGQWALNAWPNVALTFALIVFALYAAWRDGGSPLEVFWSRGDAGLVATRRGRWPRGDSGG